MDGKNISDVDAQEAVIESVIGRMFFIRPGIIRKFLPEKNMVEASVGIKVKTALVNGSVGYEELPLVVHVPIAVGYSPSAGLGTTYPIREGDPCTLMFSDRMINIFLKKGEMSMPEEVGQDNRTSVPRQHNLQDAICFPGMIVQSSVFKYWNNNAVETRDLERNVYTSVSREGIAATDGEATANITGGRATVTAPNGVALTDEQASVTIESGQVRIGAPGGVYIDAPNMKVDGSTGFLSGVWRADDFETTSGFDANSHRHSGVEPGGGTTGRFV